MSASRKRTVAECHDCHNHRRMEGRGLCSTCYHRRKRAGSLAEIPLQVRPGVDRPSVECPMCGEQRPTYARGVCRWCYDRAWRRGDHGSIPRTTRFDPEYLLGEVEHLLVWCGLPARDIPRRVGMTFSGFEKAMQRARAAGDARADRWFVAHRRAA